MHDVLCDTHFCLRTSVQSSENYLCMKLYLFYFASTVLSFLAEDLALAAWRGIPHPRSNLQPDPGNQRQPPFPHTVTAGLR